MGAPPSLRLGVNLNMQAEHAAASAYAAPYADNAQQGMDIQQGTGAAQQSATEQGTWVGQGYWRAEGYWTGQGYAPQQASWAGQGHAAERGIWAGQGYISEQEDLAEQQTSGPYARASSKRQRQGKKTTHDKLKRVTGDQGIAKRSACLLSARASAALGQCSFCS